jgi:hypothetical protein
MPWVLLLVWCAWLWQHCVYYFMHCHFWHVTSVPARKHRCKTFDAVWRRRVVVMPELAFRGWLVFANMVGWWADCKNCIWTWCACSAWSCVGLPASLPLFMFISLSLRIGSQWRVAVLSDCDPGSSKAYTAELHGMQCIGDWCASAVCANCVPLM